MRRDTDTLKVKARKPCVLHGMSRTITYRSWVSMWQRCTDPNIGTYHLYGGRGIRVCDRWRDINNFIADMGHRPSRDYSIERADSNKDYTPGNCRWATIVDQNNNTSRNVFVEYRGRRLTIAQWSREIRIPHDTLWRRFKSGKWTVEQIMTMPLRRRRDNRVMP
jgi:hypothetical protein